MAKFCLNLDDMKNLSDSLIGAKVKLAEKLERALPEDKLLVEEKLKEAEGLSNRINNLLIDMEMEHKQVVCFIN